MSRKKTYNEKFYKLSEDEMQEIVSAAQAGDFAAQNQILEIFSNFLAKYTALLYYGKYSLGDYDVRRFIGLFVKDGGVRFYLLRNKLNREGQKHVQEVLRGIRYMVDRYGDVEDIDQTVKLSFLQCVERYKRTESKSGGYVPFSGYIYSYFYFMLKKNVDEFLIDQLGRKTFPLISDEDAGSEDDEGGRPPGFVAPPEPSVEDLLHAEKIDEYWVAGDTCNPPFDELTLQERQLIKWRYVNGERSSDIANRITEHPNTVREHYHKIRVKLQEAIEKELEELNAIESQ